MKESPYTILFTREAKRNVEKLDPSIRKIIARAIKSLAANPAKGKLLAYDLAGLHSLSTSDYRIIYRVKEKKLLIRSRSAFFEDKDDRGGENSRPQILFFWSLPFEMFLP